MPRKKDAPRPITGISTTLACNASGASLRRRSTAELRTGRACHMLFNTYEFIFLFLPAVLVGFLFIATRIGHPWAVGWLTIASLLFYVSLDGANVFVLITSTIVNFAVARSIDRYRHASRSMAGAMLWVGIALNVSLFVFVKYLRPWAQPGGDAAIVLGISFFT